MNFGNTSFAPALKPASSEIAIGDLLDAATAHRAKRLVFSYDGHDVKPGYHVTEVKAAQFSALDCGANPEAWPEIFIQLWDIDRDDRTHMAAGKFAAIIRKVADHVKLDPLARLTFEVSDGIRPMQLYAAAEIIETGEEIQVALAPRAASCKPRDRWLAEQKPCCL